MLNSIFEGIDMPVLRTKTVRPREAGRTSAAPGPLKLEQTVADETVTGRLFKNCSDTPARAKTSGFGANEDHMCPICEATLPSITDPKCFDHSCKQRLIAFTVCPQCLRTSDN